MIRRGLNELETITRDMCGVYFVCKFIYSLLFLLSLFSYSFAQESNISFEYITSENGLSQNSVYIIHQDKKGFLWFGTEDGLNKYNVATKKIEQFHLKDGLPNEHIYGVLEDDQNNIWVSTNSGLSKFNPLKKIFQNFTVNDGLQDNEYNVGAFLKLKNGSLLFGGINGFNIFKPELIKEDNSPAKVVITELNFFNKPVNINQQFNNLTVLKKSITNTKEITFFLTKKISFLLNLQLFILSTLKKINMPT